MHEHLDALEERMQQLQQAMRRAQLARDSDQVKQLRDELGRIQRAWDALFAQAEDTEEAPATQDGAPRGTPAQDAPTELPALLPAREQVHQVLTLLAVPAAPKLISTVHEAFFAGTLAPSRLTSLRRDEERSYRSAPGARPYYLCPALTSDLLSPARGLFTVSTWPLEQRIVGPLSARVHFLTSALNIADAAERLDIDTLPLAARQLLTRYAQNIPGAQPPIQQRIPASPPIDLPLLRRAAQDELALHTDSDTTTRTQAAARARDQLDDAGLLFGGSFQSARRLRSVP